jgi:hypothetical protein
VLCFVSSRVAQLKEVIYSESADDKCDCSASQSNAQVSHGLSILAGYTYAHALDNGSLDLFALLPQDSRHPELEYASSDFDIRHRFTLTITYALPSKKSALQLREGWQINSIVTLQSGQPWLVDDLSSNFSGTFERADRWDFFGNPADFTSGPPDFPIAAAPSKLLAR